MDTPGFDDTNRSDTDVLKDLAYWLGLSYKQKQIQLTGLVYLHPITHVRMAGTAFKNLRTFKKLVGTGSMASVALVSTMWSASSDDEEDRRYELLINKEEYWKSMIDQGAMPYRHTNDRQSAIKIIGPLLKKKPTVLELQHELVDQGKQLNNTEAGKEVDAGISLQRELLERKIEQTRTDMNQALAAKDQKWVDQLAADQEKYERQVKDTRSAQEEMKLNMEKIFSEKEEQYKRSIEEINEKLRKAQETQLKREKQYEEDKEAARRYKEETDQRAAEHEEALSEAQAETFVTQLQMLMTELNSRKNREEESQDEYRRTAAAAQKQRDEAMLNIDLERKRLQFEQDLLVQRQREHELAMMSPPPYQSPSSSQPAWSLSSSQPPPPPPAQYYDQYGQAMTAGGAVAGAAGAAMGMMGAAALCSVM